MGHYQKAPQSQSPFKILIDFHENILNQISNFLKLLGGKNEKFERAVKILNLEISYLKNLLETKRSAGLKNGFESLHKYFAEKDRLTRIYVMYFEAAPYPIPKHLDKYATLPFRYLTKFSEFLKTERKEKKTENDTIKEKILKLINDILFSINANQPKLI